MRQVMALIIFILTCQCIPLGLTELVHANQDPSNIEEAFFSYLTDMKNPPALIDYSPSDFDPRRGKNFHLPSALSIEKDLRKLRQVFDGLIVYSYHPEVTPIVLKKAKELDYQAVVLGIWNAQSKHEMHGVIKLIHQYGHDMALALCLGNEGLYWNRYTTKDLEEAQASIRAALHQGFQIPITTSEPASSYRNSLLYSFGDFLAPNIHPVWEKPALPAKDAVFWTRNQAISLMEKSQRPVLVKETGFPHSGERHFTPQGQKKFWDMYVTEERLVYSQNSPQLWVSFASSFEAFSLPWKAEQSGEPIEAAWGLMSKDRVPYPAFYTWGQAQGSVVETKGTRSTLSHIRTR